MTGRTLGDRYELGEEIGRGGMAEVVEAQDLRLGRRVAVKLLRPELAGDPTFITRFGREAQAAAALNHPNIVAVYDTGEDELIDGATAITVPYIVMEYVDGLTLRQLLASGRRLLPERALEMTAGILAALDYSHRHGIVHRDIKPANVMLTRGGEVKVMDFGIARAISDTQSTMTSASAVMGTAQYLSPEQARGEVVDARSDLYSTGCVLFELLTDRPPFVGDSSVSVAYQHVGELPTPPSALDPSIPSTVDAIVLKSLVKDRADRYQSAAEFRNDVERAIAGMPVTAAQGMAPVAAVPAPAARPLTPATTPPPAPTSSSDRRKRGWMWVGVAAALLMLGTAGIFLTRFLTSDPAKAVTVPNIVGLTADQAGDLLSERGLQLGQESTRISDQPANTIVQQDPVAGSQLDEGQGVAIVLSAGREQVQVPNLIGMTSVDDARTALADVQLNLGSVAEADSDAPKGSVIDQNPGTDSNVDAGSRVSVAISNGRVPVPNVVNQTEAQAKSDLTNAGFQVNVTTQADGAAAPGTVLAQSPQAATSALKGTIVTLTVSTAAPVAPTPTQQTPTTAAPTQATPAPVAPPTAATQAPATTAPGTGGAEASPLGGDTGAATPQDQAPATDAATDQAANDTAETADATDLGTGSEADASPTP